MSVAASAESHADISISNGMTRLKPQEDTFNTNYLYELKSSHQEKLLLQHEIDIMR